MTWVYGAVLGILGWMMPWNDNPDEWSGYGNKPSDDQPLVSTDYTFRAYQKQGLKPDDLFGDAKAKYAEWLKSNPEPKG